MSFKFFTFCFIILFSSTLFSQSRIINADLLKPNPEKEAKFLIYLAIRHGGMKVLENWKKENTMLYYQELWYFCESFYIKRNFHMEGITLDESMIDITRFESQRKETEEAIVEMPGHRDVLVLLPKNKLIYKPQY